MDSLFLVHKLSQQNFSVNKKVTTEMKQLLVHGSWKLDYVHSSITCSNKISIVNLKTRSLYAHIDDILQDEDLMNSMIIYFQETRTDFPPKKNKILKYNFNTTYSVHGVFSCIDKNISIISTKSFSSHKVELVMSEVYAQRHVCITNIYVAPFASLSNVIEAISIAKSQMIYNDCILIVVGDFNIDIHANKQRSKQLI